ncbi:YqgE/AlgH family protein [Ferrimonas senticii]|uniref:YqgE/AlgH family protein n=1 Tax=Ferrimonas senticii TaxID=394566 RepID=UPI00040E50D6|nr:YqgE/AlgH family protein [Ferrimonas senticii]
MQSLTDHLLIAMPSLQDPYFKRSVVYLCEHNDEGAMGLIINQVLDISLEKLLTTLELKEEGFSLSRGSNNQVMLGGPVNNDRGFVLHSPIAGLPSSHLLTDQLMLTTSKDILLSLGTEQQPQHYLVALGYAGWSPGQLEQELAENSWLTVPANQQLLFEVPAQLRWQQALANLGVTAAQLSTEVGHA